MKERHSFTLNAMCRLNVVDYILTSCLLESECSCFIWLSSDLRQRIQFEWLAQGKRMERAYFSSTGQIFLNYKVLNNQALIYIYIYICIFLSSVHSARKATLLNQGERTCGKCGFLKEKQTGHHNYQWQIYLLKIHFFWLKFMLDNHCILCMSIISCFITVFFII